MSELIPTLHTERLVLRAPSMGDLPAITAFYASAQSHTVGGPRDDMMSAMTLDATIGHWVTKGYGLWAVADSGSNEWLGRVGFIFLPGWEAPELGWAVTKQAEGRGIAYEATEAARAHGASDMGLDGVISYIRPENARSAALAERLGAVLEREDTLRGTPVNIWRHPTLAQQRDTQLGHGIDMETAHYADPLFKPKGWALD